MTKPLQHDDKYLFVLPDLYPGGAERAFLNVLRGFKEINAKPELALLFGTGALEHRIPVGTPIHTLSRPRTRSSLALIVRLPSIWFRLIRLMRTHRYRAILVTMTGTTVLLITAWLAAGRPARLVVRQASVHQNVRSRLLARVVNVLYRYPNRFIAVSRSVADDLALSRKVPAGKIATITNAVDPERILACRNGPPNHPWFQKDRPPLIVGSGRLIHTKGFDLLLRALALLRHDFDARMIIVGGGIELPRLQALSESLGVHEKVDFVGYTENPLRYVRYADVFVFPSRWEGYPNILLEAACTGVPVVATDCPGGCREVLERAGTGRICPPEDPAAIAVAICEQIGAPRPPSEEMIAKFPSFADVAHEYRNACTERTTAQ